MHTRSQNTHKIQPNKPTTSSKATRTKSTRNSTLTKNDNVSKKITTKKQTISTGKISEPIEISAGDKNTASMSPLLFESDSEETCSALNIGILKDSSEFDGYAPLTNQDIFQIFSGVNDMSKNSSKVPTDNIVFASQSTNFNTMSSSKLDCTVFNANFIKRAKDFLGNDQMGKSRCPKVHISKIRRDKQQATKQIIKRQVKSDNQTSAGQKQINKVVIEDKSNRAHFDEISAIKLDEHSENSTKSARKFSSSDSSLLHKSMCMQKQTSNASDVQIISLQPSIITLSDSTESENAQIHNSFEPHFESQMMHMSPDLFNSIDHDRSLSPPLIPPNKIRNTELDRCSQTSDVVSVSKSDLLKDFVNPEKSNIFEITTNNEFSNLIRVNENREMSPIVISQCNNKNNSNLIATDSPSNPPLKLTTTNDRKSKSSVFAGLTILPRHHSPQILTNNSSIDINPNVIDLDKLPASSDDDVVIIDCIAASQEITPKRRLKLKSRHSDDLQLDTPKSSKTKWLKKCNSDDRDRVCLGNHLLSRRRLDLWFRDTANCTKLNLPTSTKSADVVNIFLTSDEETSS